MNINMKKLSASLAGIAVVAGMVAVADTPVASEIPVASVAAAKGYSFTPRQFEPRKLFNYGPKLFVKNYNEMGQTNDDSRLHAPDGKYEIDKEAWATFTKIRFETDAYGEVIYSVTISGDQPDDIKSAVLRTVFLIDFRGVSEAAAAFEKLMVEKSSDEEGILDDTIFITLGNEENSVKIYRLGE